MLAVWLSGSALTSIDVVALLQTRYQRQLKECWGYWKILLKIKNLFVESLSNLHVNM